MKKSAKILFTAILILSSLAVRTLAAPSASMSADSLTKVSSDNNAQLLTVYGGEFGDNLIWALDSETSTLTISGVGDMPDYERYTTDITKRPEWEAANVAFTKVVIEDGVTSIGNCTFFDHKNITDIIIGKDVKRIGQWALASCEGLTELTFPEGLLSFEYHAVASCTKLKNITIPDSVTSIGDGAFSTCKSVSSSNLTIGKGVKSIGRNAFYNCTGLMQNVIIPEGVTSIGDYAFDATAITSITIPDSVTSIGTRMVKNACLVQCTSSSYAYSWATENGCKISIIPSYYRVIYDANGGENAPDLQQKEQFVLLKLSTDIPTRQGYTFLGWSTTIDGEVEYLSGGTYTKNESVTLYAVWDQDIKIVAEGTCGENLTWTLDDEGTLTISGSGEMKDFGVTGAPWYSLCTSVKKLVMDGDITSIGDGAFYGCTGLISVNFSESVNDIGKYAFNNCLGLKEITIPDSVKSMGEYVFSNCQGLTVLNIGNGVTNIPEFAFSKCIGLKSIVIPDNVTNIGKCAFEDCSGVTSLEIGKSVTSIELGAFRNTALKSLEIPDNVTNLGNSAFSSTFIKSLAIGSGITSINEHAFAHCKYLGEVEIPDNVTNIGSYAFYSCDELTRITIPDSVTRIGVDTFYDCENLTIYGYSGSYAQTYANENGIPFVCISDEVTVPVTSVTLSKTSLTLDIGDTETLTATVLPDNASNKAVTWKSSNESVVAVEGGIVTAVGEGNAVIVVTTVDGNKSAICNITVTDPDAPCDATVYTDAEKYTVLQGAEFTFTLSLSGTYDGYSIDIPKKLTSGLSVLGVEPADESDVTEFEDRFMVSVLGGKSRVDSDKIMIATVRVKVDDSAEVGERKLTISNAMIAGDTGSPVNRIKYDYALVNVTDQIPGDVNEDGVFNYYDVSKLYAYYRAKTTISDYINIDINADGTFNYYDVSRLYAIYRGKADFE